MSLKILHIAPQNFAGMPLDFVKMHKSSGYESRLVTLYKNSLKFDEDICLDLKLPSGRAAKRWRDSKIEAASSGILKYNAPKNFAEKIYFNLRDKKNQTPVNNAIRTYNLYDYDIYHYDGGMDFFRDQHFASELKKRGKKIVCCYFGSDLRTRGIFKELDEMSDLNITVEFDHLKLHKNIKYIFFPFDVSHFKVKKRNNKKIKIIHSPTNRKFKGTDKILKIVNEVDKERQIEFILLENADREKVIEIKSGCDIAIDQVGGEMGGTGYGKNSIENLALEIPSITEFTEEYLKFIKENPFVDSTIETLKDNLFRLIDNESLRIELGRKGRQWVQKYHSYSSVNESLMNIYKENSII